MIEAVYVLSGLAAGMALGAFFQMAYSKNIRAWMDNGASLYRAGMFKVPPRITHIEPVASEAGDLDVEQVDTIAAIREEERRTKIDRLRLARTNGFTGKLEPVQPEVEGELQ